MNNAAQRNARARPALLVATIGIATALAACGRVGVSEPAPPIPNGDAVVGKALIEQFQCTTCHRVPGVNGPPTYVGPPLDHWAERSFIAGKLANTPENLIRWIIAPQAVEPGTDMPSLGVTPDQARDIAAYLFSLGD